MVKVKFVKTHVGHEEKLTTQRLTKSEQNLIAEKLKAGITVERILEDARNVKNQELGRINVLRRLDIRYLFNKFNIAHSRNTDDMVATAMKVEEWNSDGKNAALLFKQTGKLFYKHL